MIYLTIKMCVFYIPPCLKCNGRYIIEYTRYKVSYLTEMTTLLDQGLILCDLILRTVTLCRLLLHPSPPINPVTSYYTLSPPITPCRLLLHPVASYYTLSPPITTCHLLLHPVASFYTLSPPITSCRLLLHPVASYYTLSPHLFTPCHLFYFK